MGAGQSDLYKGTYGDTLDNIPQELREKNNADRRHLTESEIREKYIQNIKNMSPEDIFESLQNEGCEVLPLSRGRYKGVSFEAGGGFKINIGQDGIFQYHPGGKHHNDGEPYYKIATGYSGTVRYDLKGNKIGE